MKTEQAITRKIDQVMLNENAQREAEHESGTGLTASGLWNPSRTWLLKYLKIPKKQLDPFTLRKFARGRSVEDWYTDKLEKAGVLVNKQVAVEYRGCKGFADVIIKHDDLDFKLGEVPHEVKSITNAHFRRIIKTGDINYSYHLQACLYALGLGTDHYGLDIIASDDMREMVTLYETKLMKKAVNQLISEHQVVIENWLNDRTVPNWQVREKWQDIPMYMNYDEKWARFTQSQFIKEVEAIESQNAK